jgi:hypothetical protein
MRELLGEQSEKRTSENPLSAKYEEGLFHAIGWMRWLGPTYVLLPASGRSDRRDPL